ncbi:MAG: hypothetical protein ACRDOK_07105 [Streptosporangiaceae bacterium]
MESLRLEKAYRAIGRELTPDYGPVEAACSSPASWAATSGSSAASR